MREEPCLSLFGDLQFLGGVAFRFQPLDVRAALRRDFLSHFVRGQKRERVPIHICEGCGHRASRLHLRQMVKADAALAPFFELGKDILGQEHNPSGPANEFIFFRFALRSYQLKHCRTIGRGNGEPAIARWKADVKGQAEAKLVQVKSQAAILIANENANSVKPEVRVTSVRVKTASVRPVG